MKKGKSIPAYEIISISSLFRGLRLAFTKTG